MFDLYPAGNFSYGTRRGVAAYAKWLESGRPSRNVMAAPRDPVEDPDYLFRDLGGSSGDDDDENLFLARRIREIADGIQLFSPRNIGRKSAPVSDETPRASEETLRPPVWDAATGLVWDDAATAPDTPPAPPWPTTPSTLSPPPPPPTPHSLLSPPPPSSGRPKGTDATPRPRSVRTPPLYAQTPRRLGRRTTPRELKLWPSPRETRPRARRSPRSSRLPSTKLMLCAAARRRDQPLIGAPSRPPSKPSLHLRPTSTRCDGTWPPCGRASRRRAPHGSSLPRSPLRSRRGS